MLVIGGHDGAKHLNDFFQFNFDSLEWSLVDTSGQVPPPSPRDSHSAVISGECMYLFGGSTGSARNDLYAFSFETDQWQEVRPLTATGQKAGMMNGRGWYPPLMLGVSSSVFLAFCW